MAMASTTSVWVQLYIGSTQQGNVFEVDPTPKNISALKDAVKLKKQPELDYLAADRLSVYPPGTTPPFSEENSMKPGRKLADLIEEMKDATPPTSDDYPLIVVAPPPPVVAAHGQSGKLCCCFCILLFRIYLQIWLKYFAAF